MARRYLDFSATEKKEREESMFVYEVIRQLLLRVCPPSEIELPDEAPITYEHDYPKEYKNKYDGDSGMEAIYVDFTVECSHESLYIYRIFRVANYMGQGFTKELIIRSVLQDLQIIFQCAKGYFHFPKDVDMIDSIGDIIKKTRKLRKLTQKQLAEKIGVTSTTIHRWETKECDISFKHTLELAEALEMNPAKLLFMDSNGFVSRHYRRSHGLT